LKRLSAVPKLDQQFSLKAEEELVGVVVLVPDEVTLELCDLGALQNGGSSASRRKPLRVTSRRGSRMLEHETGLEPATPTLARRCWG
jgi:hypothetical protein